MEDLSVVSNTELLQKLEEARQEKCVEQGSS